MEKGSSVQNYYSETNPLCLIALAKVIVTVVRKLVLCKKLPDRKSKANVLVESL